MTLPRDPLLPPDENKPLTEAEKIELERQWEQPAYDPDKPVRATKLRGGTDP